MADSTPKIAVDGLEFYEIKQNLRDFLKSQDKFKDYNFEGAGLSVLLDVLAYNTHYINYYTNMVANEMFLDTATVRDSVVSHSKMLGYTPTSTKGARAQVSVTVPASEVLTYGEQFLPRYSIFTASSADGTGHTFRTIDTYEFEPYTFDESGNPLLYWVPEVELVEGRNSTATFVVDRVANPAQRFVIPQEAVDLSTLKVRVQASTTDISGYDEYWTLVSDPVQLSPTSKVYFVQETENRKYEVYFGDDIVGKAVKNGNIVILEYIIAPDDPTLSNGVGSVDLESDRAFALQGGFSSNFEVIVIDAAQGGAERESTQSIKYYAPLGYQAQDRAVTVEDYAFMLARDYPFADSIFVWGGEDNDPPIYGKVFISIKPSKGKTLTNQEKESIKSGVLKKFNIVGVTPEIVDPDYTYFRFENTIKMNPSKTAKNPNEVKEVVKNAVNSFVNQNLGKFGGDFLFSRYSTAIDASDPAIEASGTSISLEKQVVPNYGVSSNYSMTFANQVNPNTITTNQFLHYDPAKQNTSNPYSTAQIEDDGAGNLQVITYEPDPRVSGGALSTSSTASKAGKKRVIKSKAGTVNYSSGKLSLLDLNIFGIAGTNPVMKVAATPTNYAEIVADKNQLFTLDQTDPSANLVEIRLTTDSRLQSPSTSKTTPSFQAKQQAAQNQNLAAAEATKANNSSNASRPTKVDTNKGYPKC